MNDLISRSALLEDLEYDHRKREIVQPRSTFGIILSAPAVDAVEVVRCKDCKHSYFVKSCSKYECKNGCGTLKYTNDFCSYGERRECDKGND